MIPWLRDFFADRTRVWLVAAVVSVLLIVVHRLYFIVLPERAIKKYGRKDPERLRRYLERVVATPSLIGPAQKLRARGALVGIYLPQGRHAEAAAHCRANLASLSSVARTRRRADFPALEADIRRRLADCLEGLGQMNEAAAERQRAEACIDRLPNDPLRHLTRGTQLEREHRYDEACEAFERALALTPESNRPVRINCMCHLVLACFNAGRPVDCLRWAEEAITQGAEGRHLRSTHRMAGVACGNLGRLEESEEHYHRAYELAAIDDEKSEMAEVLANLADIQRKRGKLAEANEACLKASAVHSKADRMAIAVQSQILREWGRFGEALAMLARPDNSTKVVIPALERRLQDVRALEMSRIEAEWGKADDARHHIEEAISVLGNDAKLGLKCDAAMSWVLAVGGLAEDSRDVAAEVEARLPDFERDPSTSRGVLYDLGMAACAATTRRVKIAGAATSGFSPDPVYHPTALYFRGECRRHLGKASDARADYRAAVEKNLNTHYAGLARRRLGELPLS